MAYAHKLSANCSKTELDLFSLPPTQTSIEDGLWVQYKPLSSLTDESAIEFVIPGHGDEYLDLSQTVLCVKVRIVQDDDNILDATCDKVGPVNYFLHSLFSQMDIYWNQKLVSVNGNTYPYRAYIETLLNYADDAKTTHLSAALWKDDTAGQMDKTEDENSGLKERRSYFEASRPVEMMGYLHGDVFHQGKYLLNGVELKIKLTRSRDSFSLISKTGFKINIMEASLLVRRVRINPTTLIEHAKMLEYCTAKYPITRVDVKAFTIPGDVQGKTIDNVYLGQLPHRVVLGLVSNSAYNGSFKLNPFNFGHHNVNFLALYIDGQQIPAKALQPDYSARLYTSCYSTLFSGSGIHNKNCGNGISKSMYPNGYCLYAFDLTSDLTTSSSHWNLIRRGSLRIEIKFADALTEAVNCIVFGEFCNIIEVDKYRNVTLDYN